MQTFDEWLEEQTDSERWSPEEVMIGCAAWTAAWATMYEELKLCQARIKLLEAEVAWVENGYKKGEQ
jgi:hypothetical protein